MGDDRKAITKEMVDNACKILNKKLKDYKIPEVKYSGSYKRL